VKAGDAAVAGGEGAARALAWYERGCAHAPASPEDNPQVVPLPRNHLEIVSMMSIGSSDDPQDVAKACMAAAALLRRERHDDRAAPLERRACELGAKGACADAR
jgi:hypothetical protein